MPRSRSGPPPPAVAARRPRCHPSWAKSGSSWLSGRFPPCTGRCPRGRRSPRLEQRLPRPTVVDHPPVTSADGRQVGDLKAASGGGGHPNDLLHRRQRVVAVVPDVPGNNLPNRPGAPEPSCNRPPVSSRSICLTKPETDFQVKRRPAGGGHLGATGSHLSDAVHETQFHRLRVVATAIQRDDMVELAVVIGKGGSDIGAAGRWSRSSITPPTTSPCVPCTRSVSSATHKHRGRIPRLTGRQMG